MHQQHQQQQGKDGKPAAAAAGSAGVSGIPVAAAARTAASGVVGKGKVHASGAPVSANVTQDLDMQELCLKAMAALYTVHAGEGGALIVCSVLVSCESAVVCTQGLVAQALCIHCDAWRVPGAKETSGAGG